MGADGDLDGAPNFTSELTSVYHVFFVFSSIPLHTHWFPRLQVEGDESVLCRVTHLNLKSFNADVHFSLQVTVEAMKEKLWKKCGTTVDSMSLELYDDAGAKIADLTNNARSFGFYSPMDGTFRKFKEKLELKSPSGASTKLPENYMEDLCANIKVSYFLFLAISTFSLSLFDLWSSGSKQYAIVPTYNFLLFFKAGDSCQVQPGDKRGIVKYVGQAENLGPGFWVGVQYDEPLGKHDGLVKGTRYFDCSNSTVRWLDQIKYRWETFLNVIHLKKRRCRNGPKRLI
uniref:CAP-Gly domain-containing protein n=1 Tax=Chenopodium quinoa TaxID=63459 RepID=A0A803MNQ6_CHEQI